MSASFQRTFWLGTLAVMALCEGLLADGEPMRPIEYSAPKETRGLGTSGSLLPGHSPLDQLESDLNNPLKAPLSGNSLGGMIMATPPPVPPPAVENPKLKQLIQKQEDWMFLNSDEVFSIKSPDDQYKPEELTPDGRKRSSLRPMERRILDIFSGNNLAQTNVTGAGTAFGSSPFDGNNNDPAALSPVEKSIRRAFGLDTSGSAGRASVDAANFFGFNNGYKPPAKLSDAELQRAEDFKKILDFNNTRPDVTAPLADSPFASPYVDSSFYDPPKPTAPVLTPTPSAAANGNSLNGSLSENTVTTPWWSPATQPTPPTPPPARAMPAPVSPFMNIPRRNF